MTTDTGEPDGDIDWMFFFHGVTTQPGWARNNQKFQWELHNTRGRVVGWIAYEACRPLWDDSYNEAPAGAVTTPREAFQDLIAARFGCPLPL